VKVRNCAWAAQPAQAPKRRKLVWARGKVVTRQCPKSIITAQSLQWLEEFRLWKQLGGDPWVMPAKSADALLLLEQEWRTETKNGNV
jgi:hypothetical protein